MSASKQAREKWNAEHYSQINISVDKELAVEFKSSCAVRGVSVAGAIKSFMAAYTSVEEKCQPGNQPGAKKPSRGARRKEVIAIVKALSDILAEQV